jgi:hypothetical protein
MKRFYSLVLIAGLLISTAFTNRVKEEGMYMLNMLGKLDLAKAGLQIPINEIYNTDGNSLTHALVRLGGCTGSFISDEGLIITNHHCVYGSVSAMSSAENNLLENGFYADTKEKEIKVGLPAKITQSFVDVSSEVLKGVNAAGNTPEMRNKLIAENIERITKEEQDKNADLKIEISEMMIGKYYTLYRYKILTDTRLVFVPPASIGKFGGESDNWVWPRHNGDFSVVRAYENGKPYVPARSLKVNARGTNENDFVFILGYPGRTYRHMPAEYFTYQYKHILPFISDWFNHRINVLEKDAGTDVNKQLNYAGTIASLANTAKNFSGKIQGLTRTDIIANKYKEQVLLQQWIDAEPNRKKLYGDVLPQIANVYEKLLPKADVNLMLGQLYSSSGVFYAASFIADLDEQTDNMKGASKKLFFELNQKAYFNKFKSSYGIVNENIDKTLLKDLLYRFSQLPLNQIPAPLLKIIKNKEPRTAINAWVDKCYKKTKWLNTAEVMAKAEKDISLLLKYDDEMSEFAEEINKLRDMYSAEFTGYNSTLSSLLPRLADLKESYYQNMFIPDANATLRFTYGYVKGYSPQDAVVHHPFTTIKGIVEKAEDHGDYYMPEAYLKTFRDVVPADALRLANTNDVVVGLLYNLDTSGGNSGSPILNAKGELIGVNFDRAYTATINDFAWNEAYSRSIGVDIRYVLYVMKYIKNADGLLKEIGVSL